MCGNWYSGQELQGIATSMILSPISASVVLLGLKYAQHVGGIVPIRRRLCLGGLLAIVALYGGAVLVFDHLAPHL